MEKLEIKGGSKIETYESVIPQIQSLIEGEEDLIANLANIAAALKEAFNHLWIGFYIVRADNIGVGKTLVLGAVSGADCLHENKIRKGCLRYGLEGEENLGSA